MDPSREAARAADVIHRAFDDFHLRFRSITRRTRQRFERRDFEGIRQDTVERLELQSTAVVAVYGALIRQLGDGIAHRELWPPLKEAYTRAILGRDDFELAQSFFNSLSRRVFPHSGVDSSIDYLADEFPLPFKGWEMASARMYAVRRIDGSVLCRVLEDADFRARFRDLEGDAELAAARISTAVTEVFGDPGIEAFDVLHPVFIRNKGAYLVGRVRRGGAQVPVILALVSGPDGLEIDAVLLSENEASILFSFARWYFHADVGSPREVIGFLSSIMPRKKVAELYISLGFHKHGKTEYYRDLARHIAESEDRFELAPGQPGLVMVVFTLPSFEFVFKVIKDSFPPQKKITRSEVRERYRRVLEHDRVGRLVDFQEFEHLRFPRARFDENLLNQLLEEAGRTVKVEADDVVLGHLYVGRRVTPLDLFLEDAPPEEARKAVLDLGWTLKELGAADIFPGDILLKNFGVTRHGRVVSYDYDELRPLLECRFRRFPPARNPEDEMAAEPWFSVDEGDIFPEELRTFLGLRGELLGLFSQVHGDLYSTASWKGWQEQIRGGELLDFFPYPEARRLRASETAGREGAS